MANGIVSVPEPSNEPIQPYSPGTADWTSSNTIISGRHPNHGTERCWLKSLPAA